MSKYKFEGQLNNGRTIIVHHHEENPSTEALKRIAEQTIAGVAAHMIVRFVSKGRMK